MSWVRLPEPMLRVVNLADALARVDAPWDPHVAGHVNDMHVKVVKLRGEFVWHQHAREDEMFLVLKGILRLQTREGDLLVRPGEFVVVPQGVEHCPRADEEVHALLFEPASTLNTGDVRDARTKDELKSL